MPIIGMASVGAPWGAPGGIIIGHCIPGIPIMPGANIAVRFAIGFCASPDAPGANPGSAPASPSFVACSVLANSARAWPMRFFCAHHIAHVASSNP